MDTPHLEVSTDRWYRCGVSSTIAVDESGRVELPESVRKQFQLSAGSLLRLEPVGDHLELTPVTERISEVVLKEKNGLLVVGATGTPCDASVAVEETRADRERAMRS